MFKKAVYHPGHYHALMLNHFNVNVGTKKDDIMLALMGQLQVDFRTLFRFNQVLRDKVFMFQTTEGIPKDAATGAIQQRRYP